ncbi:hypothetical protein [Roseibium sp.]|uniref:hypothetical protein n=1 Tax=Roseibium sp. TaxID=1936156 RepID=UPI003D120267
MLKTYKRETAWAMLVGLAALCVFDLWTGGKTNARDWADLFIYPAFGFAVAAFGFDAAAKWPRSGREP